VEIKKINSQSVRGPTKIKQIEFLLSVDDMVVEKSMCDHKFEGLNPTVPLGFGEKV
jgi:hypothetical protein